MDNDGATLSAVLLDIGEVEADRQLEIELDGRALMLAAMAKTSEKKEEREGRGKDKTVPESVEDVDVDLGAIEGAISGVQLPTT